MGFGGEGTAISLKPRPRTSTPVGTPSESHAMYDSNAIISRLSAGSGLPFIDRSKQSLMRSVSDSTLPRRVRYSGKTPHKPASGAAYATRPASRWQLAQVSPLPTNPAANARVFVTSD